MVDETPPLPEAVREQREALYRWVWERLVNDSAVTFASMLDRLISATAEAAAQQERARLDWQPIATAPQDGTSFLACAPASSTFLAHWANGVVDGASWTDDGGYEGRHATHWMPLPRPAAAHPPPTPEDR